MDESNRMLTKKFNCQNCNRPFKKLVQISVDHTKCPYCDLDQCPEIIEANEFNRENIDGSYSINFDKMSKKRKKEYHNVTDTKNTNINNIYGDNQRPINKSEHSTSSNNNNINYNNNGNNYRNNYNNFNNNNYNNQRNKNYNDNNRRNNNYNNNQRNNNYSQNYNNNQRNKNNTNSYMNSNQNNNNFTGNLFSNPMGFVNSMMNPFQGNFSRNGFNFDGIMNNLFFGNVNNINNNNNNFSNNNNIYSDNNNNFFDDYFQDNYASNFASSFIDPLLRANIVNNMRNENHREQKNPPASKESIRGLKRFKMEKKYAKKKENTNNEYEYPECTICLCKIGSGDSTILLPCSHMFHDKCIEEWLNRHNTCPLCRYELPTDNREYENERNQRNRNRRQNHNRMRNNGSNSSDSCYVF